MSEAMQQCPCGAELPHHLASLGPASIGEHTCRCERWYRVEDGAFYLSGRQHNPFSAMLDFAEPEPGMSPPPEDWDGEHCPCCGEEVTEGFGMAGGGMGPYWMCSCGWFWKEAEVE